MKYVFRALGLALALRAKRAPRVHSIGDRGASLARVTAIAHALAIIISSRDQITRRRRGWRARALRARGPVHVT